MEKTDREQLAYASENHRVILTQNIKHFIDLQREYFRKELQHDGIVVTNILPFKELIRRIINFLSKKQPAEMRNNLEWLQNYR